MSGIFGDLLAVNKASALDFFLSGLKDVARLEPDDEMLYVASILAHYSLTSRYDTSSFPSLSGLAEVFDQFFWVSTNDPEILELGGSQVLLFAGFFRDQMRRRHNVRWYDQIGQSFYNRAGSLSKEKKKSELFGGLSKSLPTWALCCRNLHRSCRRNSLDRYMIKID